MESPPLPFSITPTTAELSSSPMPESIICWKSFVFSAVLETGMSYSLAVSRMISRSFNCMCALKPGSRLPSNRRGGLTSSVQHWAAPPLIASTTLRGSTPAFFEKTSSSPIATICAATMIWLAAFAT
jgi:hypothetical protein